jgi:hypothetical protein
MFFRTPDDLVGIDVGAGACYNASVPQNLTFGYQNVPGRADGEAEDGDSGGGRAADAAAGSAMMLALVVAVMVAVVM